MCAVTQMSEKRHFPHQGVASFAPCLAHATPLPCTSFYTSISWFPVASDAVCPSCPWGLPVSSSSLGEPPPWALPLTQFCILTSLPSTGLNYHHWSTRAGRVAGGFFSPSGTSRKNPGSPLPHVVPGTSARGTQTPSPTKAPAPKYPQTGKKVQLRRETRCHMALV